MEYKDYYKVLGVAKNASEKDIRRAYRKLARQYHPDVNPGDPKAEERFKEINEAYEVLSDPEKRAKYDRLGSSWQQWQGAGRDPRDFDWSQWAAGFGAQGAGPGVRYEYYGEPFSQGGFGAFSDLFNFLFGGSPTGETTRRRVRFDEGGRRRTTPIAGQDIEQAVEITLEEAFHGTQRILEKDGRRLQVKIPPGVKTGSRVRISGEGAPGLGGAAGDLYLRVTVLPHERFRREGSDLYVDVPVDLYTAVLGGEVQVPTLDGSVMLRIPPETQGGRTFRLRGKGLPHLRHPSERGDLLAKVQIQIPLNLSARERELFEELARLRRRQP